MRLNLAKPSPAVGLAAALSALLMVTGCSNSEPSDNKPESAPSSAPSASPTAADDCAADGPFVPTSLTIDGLVEKAPVISVPRDKSDIPGVLPLTAESEDQFAFDKPGIQPGSAAGSVLLNTHTWGTPEGMGDRMLTSVRVGTQMKLYDEAGQPVCYEVTKRQQVKFDFDPAPIYQYTGPEQLVFVVCSGKRVKAGVWTHRTLWFARPVGAVTS